MQYRNSFYLLLLLLAAPVANAQQPQASKISHLLARTTYGVRAADSAQVAADGIDHWLDQQLHPDRLNDSAVEQMLSRLPTLKMNPDELASAYPRQGAKQQDDGMQMRANPRRILIDLVSARLIRATQSERQLEQMMTDFWFNHFNVFWGKGPDRYLIADYENNAIRPHVFGKFYDLLEATAQHPAMLVYLDNATSNARRGINENYARELMELHTLGVDGGYTQKDVQEVARAFTGWTVARRAGGEFMFARALHDDGEKVILGHKLPAGRGIEDGKDVLRMLSRSPATAQHIARQLIERFATDQPPQAYVAEIAAVFLKTDGDLRAVTRALFTSPYFYAQANIGSKVKTPFELVASALRTTGTNALPAPQLLQTLRTLGELPYAAQAPNGYPATSQDWVNSGSMLARMNFGVEFAKRAGRDDLALVLGSPQFQMK